jgi:isopenicillin-N epimerase
MSAGIWALDPTITHLNHGSFGAVALAVGAAQDRWRARWEAETTGFVTDVWEPALDRARDRLAALVGALPKDLVFVPNATTGVNVVVRSLTFRPGDELLTTDHEYNACRNVLDHVAEHSGARVVVAPVPFPLSSPEEVVTAVMAGVTDRTQLALIDHITSVTGLVMPITDLVTRLEATGVSVMVDGAHGPGMVPIELNALGASYYTGNNHKWIGAPKGSAFLWARADRVDGLIPSVISHGWNDRRTDRPRFHLLFDYPGTVDVTPHLVVPDAIDLLSSLDPGGLTGLQDRNRNLALEARRLLCDFLAVSEPAPASMIGAMAAIPLPEGLGGAPPSDELSASLFEKHRIRVPVFVWPDWPHRLIRVSAMAYNTIDDYEHLIKAMAVEL